MEKKIYIRTLILLSIFVSGLGYLPLEVKGATGVPEIIHYQGRLLNGGGGTLLGGTAGVNYCFRFSIYDDAAVGAPDTKLWPAGTPSGMKINVKNGVFNVGIGDTAAGGDTLTYNFQDNDTVYLNVEVAELSGATCAAGDGAETWENVAPRQQIVASGFALNAGTLLGLTPSQYASGTQIPVLNSGNLSLGGTNPQINATGSNVLFLQGGGGTGNIQFFSASNTLASSGALTLGGGITSTGLTINSFGSGGLVFANSGGSLTQSSTALYWDNVNGRLGIGNNTPSSTLHVSGDGRITGTFTIDGNTILGNASTSDLVTFNSRINSDLIPGTNAVYNFGSAALYWKGAFIDTLTANNISAGSSTIAGTSAATFTINTDNATADTEGMSLIFFRGTVVPNALIDWDAVLDRFDFNQPVFVQSDSGSSTIISLLVQASSGQTADIFRVSDSSGTSTLTVTSGGKIGIGTTSPSTTLHVIGTGRFSSGLTLDNGLTLTAGNFTLSGLNTNSLLYTNGSNVLTALASSTAAKVLVATSTAPYFSWETVPAINSLNGLTGGIQTFATSTETNLGIKIVSSGTTHTFTPIWIGTLGVSRGGTGTSTTPTNGQLLIGNGTDYTLGALGQGTGISVANATGTITLTNTGVQSLTAGEDISVSSATGTVTLNNTAVTRRALQGTGISIVTTAGSSTVTNTGVQSLTGTANQVTVSSATGTVTLSTPQDIAAGSSPTFTGLTLSGLTPGSVLFASTGGLVTQSSTKLYWDNVNGRLGIGANAPSTTLDVVGSARISATSTTAFQVAGSGTVLSVNTVTGLVGIGTAGPSEKLQITGGDILLSSGQTVRFTGASGDTNYALFGTSANTIVNAPGGTLSLAAAGTSIVRLSATGGLSVGNTYVSTDPGLNNLIIQGSVGIGTTSPSTVLHVSGTALFGPGTASITAFRVISSSTLPVLSVDTINNRIGINTNAPSTTLDVIGGARINATSTTAFQVVSSGTVLSVNTVSGNVGIGTADPGAKLDVVGDIRAKGDSNIYIGDAASDSIGRLDGSANAVYLISSGVSGQISFRTGGENDRVRIDSSGNVGIGTTSPAAGGGLTIAPSARTSGSPALLTITGPADTTLATSTEATDVNFNLARIVQFNTGNITTQRAALIQAPTYAFVGASTITDAATLAITGAPSRGANATITNAHGLLIQGGNATSTNAYGLTVNAPTGGTNNYAAALLGGNVGIGTTGPGAKLDIRTGADATKGLSIKANSSAQSAALLEILDSDGTVGLTIDRVGNITSRENRFNTDIGNGRVGIGGTDTAGLTITPKNTGDATLILKQVSGQTGDIVRWFSNTGTQLGTIQSGGNVGIGTTSPSTVLHVSGTALFGPGTASTTAFRVISSSTLPVLSVDTINNRIGVNTNAPSTTLDVVGNARVSATSTTAFQIVSSSTGLTFDSVNNRLGINATPANGLLTIGTDTTAATGGLYFGTDTNLYRSAASTLKTDSALTVAGLLKPLGGLDGGGGTINFSSGIWTLTSGSRINVVSGIANAYAVDISPSLSGSTNAGINVAPTFSAANANNYTGIRLQPTIGGSVFTQPDFRGIYVANPTLTGGATITTNYGAYIDNQTAGSTNYGLYFAGTGTGNAINWGGDTNLYRSAADTLKTDDSFVVAATSTTAFQIQSSSTGLTFDSVNNRLGIGTTTPSSTLDVRGNLTLSSGAKISPLTDAATGLKISTATGTDYVFFDTANARVGIGGVTPSTTLHVVGNIGVTGPTTNSLIYTNATGVLTALASSTAGKVLTATGTAPYFSWETASGGITSLNGLTGATQTFSTDTGISITSAGSDHKFGVATSTNFTWTGRHTFNATSTFATTTLTGSTAGSVLFIGAGNAISQSSTSLTWDNVNGRLGIGTSIITPSSTLHVSGTALFKAGTDSATAFQFQNSSGNSLLTVDTTNSKLIIGPNGSAPGLLVLGTSSTSTDPTCAEGAVYYNASTTQFRGCAGSSWTSLGDNQPRVRIFHNANQSTSNNTSFLVLFNSEDFDTDNTHSTSTNTSRITINTAGVYQITVNTDWAANSTGSRGVKIHKNGSTTNEIAAMRQGGNLDARFTMTTLQNLAVGDFIEVVVFQDSGGALNLLTVAAHSPYFMAVKVADPPSGADLAELFPSTEELSAGDIVAIDTGNPIHIKKSDGAYSSRLLGVVSTAPGIILGEPTDEPTFPIALAGRVPVKVSGINGPIAVGDFITSSPIPGVGMKATKAGPVIGKAISSFDPEHDLNLFDGEGMGVIVMLVNLGYYNGQTVVPSLPGLTDIISPSSTLPVDAGKQILLELLNRKNFTEETPSGATLYLSELNTDRVTAGLEIISPRVVTRNLATDSIEPATGQDLTISLNSEGRLVLRRISSLSSTSTSSTSATSTAGTTASETVFSIDSSGNAFFAGEVRAGAVTADKITGLEILTDKIFSLSNTVQDLVTTEANGSSTTSIKGGLTVIGDASFGEVRAMNILAETIKSPAIDSLKEGIALLTSTTERLTQEAASSSQAINALSASLNVLSERLVPLENQQKVSLSSSSTQGGGLNVDAVSILKGGLKVASIGALDSEITFMNDVIFFGRPYFTTDTAGFAVVSQGQREVNITFEREYIEKPIVNVTISLDESVDSGISEQILGGDIRYIVTKVGVRGFTILLNKPAPTDIPFSWTALAVKGAKIFTLIPSPAPALEAPVIETQSSSSSESTAGTSSEINANPEPVVTPPTESPSPETPAESASSTL